ncbi:MAG: cupredoxin domain-containing protein, partial [bacterium]
VAGVLVLFLAFYNINAQLNVLGFPSLSNIKIIPDSQQVNNNSEEGLPPIVDGKQILEMSASSSGYSPNYLRVRAGVPVRWEITDTGTSGCTNAIISRGLFSEEIDLTPGQTSIKEFTPTKPGKYKFSCWMGMVSGIIEVVDDETVTEKSGGYAQAADVASADNNEVVPSGAKGCGCGSGGGTGCGGTR